MSRNTAQENFYLQRINAVIGFIREHLHEDLSLEALAQVAGFSHFHFHRLFTSLTGETINEIVMRLRLERAVALLRSTPSLSITEAAFEGASSRSPFFRAPSKDNMDSTPGSGTGKVP